MSGRGPESDIVISSRVRIARNLSGYPFPTLATESQREQLLADVQQASAQNHYHFHWQAMGELEPLAKQVLVEKHLISPNLANEARQSAVLISADETVSVMVNEEDHLRIQCLYAGLQVKEAWEQANAVDDLLEAKLDFAYDETRGYLTSCPTNVGTGIRASVMMHLPALVLTQQINRILAAITQVGLVVRGIYGEGSEATGNLFQISNQITLGQSEPEIIENLLSVVSQIITHERAARERLMKESPTRMLDKVQRSLGILTHAAIIDSKEAAARLSDVRLGIDLNLIEGLPSNCFTELLVNTQPGFLQQHFNQTLGPEERDIKRAQWIRARLTHSSIDGGASL
jgi:protein arginine kinase